MSHLKTATVLSLRFEFKKHFFVSFTHSLSSNALLNSEQRKHRKYANYFNLNFHFNSTTKFWPNLITFYDYFHNTNRNYYFKYSHKSQIKIYRKKLIHLNKESIIVFPPKNFNLLGARKNFVYKQRKFPA